LFSNISKHGAGKESQGSQKELVICGENQKVMFLGEQAGNQDKLPRHQDTIIFQQAIKSFILRSDMTVCVYGMSNGQSLLSCHIGGVGLHYGSGRECVTC